MSKALDKTYDGIIIGADHHGLILGSYLAKAGLDILLVERRLTYGGGLSTREVTLPGFYHNLHSINHFHISETPWFKDLELDARVTYITPRYEFGQAHRDGSALVLGRDLEESVANIARFSKKDAATFRELNRKAERITREILSALMGMSLSMARELGPDNITVNAILPGATFTEIERKTVTPQQKERIIAMQCVPRAEVPEDLVGAVLFLASEGSAFVTGQSINLDGGVTAS